MAALHYNEWEIKDWMKRYKTMTGIELNNDQAEKMIRYEEEKSSGSSEYYFSIWEELDYEEVNFKEILTAAQFEKYMADRPKQLKRIEESLIENDKQYLLHLNASEEQLDYYKNILVPSLHKRLFLFNTTFNSDKEKVDFLKSAYRKYLADAKKKMLVDHFRHSKTFQPTILKLSILRHQQICLLPDYFSFKVTLDIPTKAVADFLLDKLSRISEELYAELRQTMDELREFNTSNTAKHIGEIRGWHTILPINNKTEELMFTVLFDP